MRVAACVMSYTRWRAYITLSDGINRTAPCRRRSRGHDIPSRRCHAVITTVSIYEQVQHAKRQPQNALITPSGVVRLRHCSVVKQSSTTIDIMRVAMHG